LVEAARRWGRNVGLMDVPHVELAAIDITIDAKYIMAMLTPAQLRAARALLNIDQRTLADRAGVSLPTIQRMEASEGYVRCVVDTLTKVVAALQAAGVELISENSVSTSGGRGVRLRDPALPRATASRTVEKKRAVGRSAKQPA
jgi:transcriptional regulator with XRE-family HTH domain